MTFPFYVQGEIVFGLLLRGESIGASAILPAWWEWPTVLVGLYFFAGEQGYALRHREEVGLHRRLSRIGPRCGAGRLLEADHHWLVYLEHNRLFYLPVIIRVAKADITQALREQQGQELLVSAEWFRLWGRLDVTERAVDAVTVVRGSSGQGWRLRPSASRPRMKLLRQLHLGRRFRRKGLFDPTVQQLEELLRQLETAHSVR